MRHQNPTPSIPAHDPAELPVKLCTVEAVVCPKLSFATHQNDVPVLRDLRLQNECDRVLENLQVHISAYPAVFQPRTWKIDRIHPGTSVEIRNRDLPMNADLLLSVQEAISARITVRLTGPEQAEPLWEQDYGIEILACNEWGGAEAMPDLLAAFVQPNDPAVSHVLKSASHILRTAGKPDDLSGYQSKSRKRSYELASAIWSAISVLGLTYALPPASFEIQGQKIRTPSQILEQGLVTCLDGALLFASALEQAGLNPMVILTKDHAFAGAWLQPQEFPSLLTDDASSVRKRVQLQELVVFETTLCTGGSGLAFSKAIAEGNRQIAEDCERDFVLAIDVRRARMQRIRPLALPGKHADPRAPGALQVSAPDRLMEQAPPLPDFDLSELDVPATPEGRLERWQRRLLDLTARNRLLHTPATAVVPLLCPDAGHLEDALAEGKSFRVVPAPELQGAAGRDLELYKGRTGESLPTQYAADALARGEILAAMPGAKLDSQLVELFRKARVDLAEGGANTLFLALGFLSWRKSPKDTRSYRAPLVLLPVKLERRSVGSGVRLSAAEDEPRINLTLLEMLRQEFRLEIPEVSGALPRDAHGIDLTRIWTAVRKAVRDTPGFEVVEDVTLGSFSFAKYLMWKDLVDRIEALKANRVVRHLLESPRDPYPHARNPPRPEVLDREVAPGDLFAPLAADSSQLAAVVGSAQGCDFVLDGPPGTGKSQTIANMIAHNLALGRRVLFVAEKRAALDVVYRRLQANGLGPFCLELHSNKANKKEVLEQLDSAWTAAEQMPAQEWINQAAELQRERDTLNDLVSALHHVHPNGWTVHRALGQVLLRGKDGLLLNWPTSDQHDADAMRHLQDVARRLGLQWRALDGLNTAAFRQVGHAEWSNAWQANLLTSATAARSASGACSAAFEGLSKQLGFDLLPSSTVLAALAEFADLLPEAADRRVGFVLSVSGSKAVEAVKQASGLIAGYVEAARSLSVTCTPELIRGLPLDHLATEWAKAKAAPWPLSHFKRKAYLAELSRLGVPGLDLDRDMDRLRRMRELHDSVEKLGEEARYVPGWKGLETDQAIVDQTLILANSLRTAVARLANTPAQATSMRSALQMLLEDAPEQIAEGSAFRKACSDYVSAYRVFSSTLSTFEQTCGSPDGSRQDDLLSLVSSRAAGLIENIAGLNGWTAWLRVRNEALRVGLGPLVESLEAGVIDPLETLSAFDSAYARWWVQQVMDETPGLRGFNLAEQTDRLARFRALDDSFTELTRRYIRAKLCGAIPSKSDPKLQPGLSALRHQLQLKRPTKAVRELVSEMGSSLTRLAPCLLMSPLSVAQFLPADAPLFDLVIFDEASQIAPWDAVGAIARGRQVVVAGDPKQMPPTSFFDRNAMADDDGDAVEDHESLLDECLGAALPQHRLTWHYRSLHESLIAFSNHTYYGDELVTFPAPVTTNTAVSWKQVSGAWSRGNLRTNPIEAQAIVAEVVRRLTDSSCRDSQQRVPSIGVITLNADQQKLIEDLLDRARMQHPEIEPFFAEECAEPVVVKNLETVQGDERDVILLGIGYGPETPNAPVMSMNFGPLNRAGGWRRLNVAVTRARREMTVYTSFPPHLIDLNRSSADALRDLKHFIQFADQGPRALGLAIAGSMGSHESPFEQAVAQGLRDRGWNVVPQVGVSRYRIDLGVVHPDRPGDYLVGVECDGAMYHSAATARDRDKIRESVLRQLGWTLIRVWSTDWWIDHRSALERLDAALRMALAERREADAATERVTVQEGSEHQVDADLTVHETALHQPTQLVEESTTPCEFEPSANTSATVLSPASERTYRSTTFEDEREIIDADSFYEPGYSEVLGRLIRKVVAQEAPIRDELLVERIARAHGFLRSGHRIRQRIAELAESMHHLAKEDEDVTFVWPDALSAKHWCDARYPETAEDCRSIEDIALAELAAALQSLQGGEDLAHVARRFGIKRLSAQARSRLDRAHAMLERCN